MNLKLTGLTAILMALSLNALSAPTDTKKPAKPVTKWTCDDFLSVGESYQPFAVGWATAYNKAGKPEDTVLDSEGIETLTPAIVQFCKRNPTSSFWDKVKAEFKKHF